MTGNDITIIYVVTSRFLEVTFFHGLNFNEDPLIEVITVSVEFLSKSFYGMGIYFDKDFKIHCL